MCYFLNLNQHSNWHPHVAAGAAVSFCFMIAVNSYCMYVDMESLLKTCSPFSNICCPSSLLGMHGDYSMITKRPLESF